MLMHVSGGGEPVRPRAIYRVNMSLFPVMLCRLKVKKRARSTNYVKFFY